ncbi:chromate transport protein ChrA [Actinoplanes lutulentus]|uniref:Uncharacterized protein DUF3180 n=1 Tax=Actinoplanes lutulentus TaxID=1287878 RepID=A0A327ZCM8_9ACTN|nr:DUF3180 domain-containing protein [Actinoplanes lutulentus]MBB2945711.1 chromate transport protein ChrA [Actinoplanes lutulentus]RAK37760.1 uncharacterized protein DUF3180 [Actinoplanes lutulentus]
MSANPQDGRRPDPSLRPTSISVLVVAGLAAAAVGWLLLSFSYSRLPSLPWTPALILAVLAVAEAMLAQNTSARIQRKPGALPVEPLAVARYVALAKASSLVGAIFAGFSAGLLTWLLLEPTKAARDDIPATAGGLIAGLALIGAALWLERSCRVPEQPDREDDDSGRPTERR